jgi:hypothetical protein
MKNKKWFGYVDKENKAYVSLYSRWDYHALKKMDIYNYIIEPFYAPSFEEAKLIADKKCNKLLEEELNNIKEI